MYNLTDISVIKKIMSRHGFSFSKALGQNFITDPDICPKMAELSGITQESGVIEIGAGVGVLTAELAKRAKRVISVELDTRLLPILEDTLADFENISVINADIMKINLEELINENFSDCKDVCVCANLPYYITSPIIMMLLESRLDLKTVTVMVQQEAGDRLCAQVGSRQAGAVTAAVCFYAEARELFKVPRTCFMPSPNVDSAVIRLDIRKNRDFGLIDEEFFFKTVKGAFSQRRKTAANGISSFLNIDKALVIKALENISLPSNIRAEALTMEQLCALSNELFTLTGGQKK